MLAPVHSGSGGDYALPVCLGSENSHRLEGLWWAMQHSDDPSREAAVVTVYLDESGTDDAAPTAVVGGLILNKSGFLCFDDEWAEMLKEHAIAPPLHIKEFRRPQGRLANISNDARLALFSDAAKLINTYKIYSVAATVTSEAYKKHFDKQFRKEGMSIYGSAFITCAYMNHSMAKQNNYRGRIAFVMDAGNEFAEHVRGAHFTTQDKEWAFMNIGPLTFDSDTACNPLQAADVIAWASRHSLIGTQSCTVR